MSKFVLNETKTTYINYHKTDDHKFFPAPPVNTVNRLPAGVYRIGRTQGGALYSQSMPVTSDELIDLPSFISNEIINEINKFWTNDVQSKYERRGMVYKRGILLYGQPGTGKSSIIVKLMETEVNKGNLVLFCPMPSDLSEFVKIMRQIEGNRRVLVVYEEFDKLLQYDEGGFLSLLDGELQIDNVVYIATTNYLDRIPPRIKNRPSRFATVIQVGLPNAETRRKYIESKTFPDENVDIESWVKATDGLTIDRIKDLIINVFCIGFSLEEAVKRMNQVSSNDSTEEHDIDDMYNSYGNEENTWTNQFLKLYGKLK